MITCEEGDVGQGDCLVVTCCRFAHLVQFEFERVPCALNCDCFGCACLVEFGEQNRILHPAFVRFEYFEEGVEMRHRVLDLLVVYKIQHLLARFVQLLPQVVETDTLVAGYIYQHGLRGIDDVQRSRCSGRWGFCRVFGFGYQLQRERRLPASCRPDQQHSLFVGSRLPEEDDSDWACT